MSGVADHVVSPGKLTQEERDALHRLLGSNTFATAPRLRSVLAHLAQMLEAGKTEELSEQSIGQEIFGKPAGYNYGEDNIVRVTVRHLRTRLDEYYRTEGSGETHLFSIPKGKYIPGFTVRGAEAIPSSRTESELVQAPKEEVVEETEMAPPAQRRSSSFPPLSARLMLALLASAIVGAMGGIGAWSGMHRAHAAHEGILAMLCPQGRDATVVVVDSNLQVYRSVFGKQVSLEDYINRRYGQEPLNSSDPRLENALHFALSSAETNVSSAIVAASIKQALPGRQVVIRQPHEVSVPEFQGLGDVVLLGGPWINPWGQLFEGRLNFRMLPLPSEPSSSHIHNYQPAPGEASDYSPHMDGNLTVNYVRIAILPNFDRKGRVFLIGATSTEALEAGGDFLTDSEASGMLLKDFGVKQLSQLPPLEVLLEVKGLNGVPGARRIIAWRSVHYE